MAEAVMERVSEQIAQSAQRISKAAESFADVLDEGITVAKRAAKHSGDALEEMMDEYAAHQTASAGNSGHDVCRRIQRGDVVWMADEKTVKLKTAK